MSRRDSLPDQDAPALWGWQWVGTDRAWPAILGDPPPIPGATWRPIYR